MIIDDYDLWQVLPDFVDAGPMHDALGYLLQEMGIPKETAIHISNEHIELNEEVKEIRNVFLQRIRVFFILMTLWQTRIFSK